MATSTVDYKQLLLSFEGRINRQVYWVNYVLPVIVISIIVGIVDGLIDTRPILSYLLNIGLIYPGLAVATKRWHDRGKSGWWSLILLIPIVGAIWFLIEVGCLRGTAGQNRFGPDPLG